MANLPAKLAHLSYSSYWNYSTCPFKFLVMSLLKYRDPDSVKRFYGIVHDDSVTWDYAHKKVTAKNRPKDDVKDYFRSCWDAKKDGVLDWEEEDPKKLRDVGTKGVDVFYDQVMQVVQPAEVQPDLERTFKGTDFKLIGRADFIEKIGVIGDNKTSDKKKSETFMGQSIQPVMYSIMLDGVEARPREIRFDILVYPKKDPPWVQQMKSVVTQECRVGALAAIASTVAQINKSLETKNFPPLGYGHGDWVCGSCGCQDLCRKVWKIPVGSSRLEVILSDSKEAKAASAGDDAVIQKLKKLKAENEVIGDDVLSNLKNRNIVL